MVISDEHICVALLRRPNDSVRRCFRNSPYAMHNIVSLSIKFFMACKNRLEDFKVIAYK